MRRWGWSVYLGMDATAPPGATTDTPGPPSGLGPRDEKLYKTPPRCASSADPGAAPPGFTAGDRMAYRSPHMAGFT